MNKTEMVVVFKEQLGTLVNKYKQHINDGEMKKSIETLRLIKETSNLIDMYDYEFMVSSYTVKGWEEDIKMVAIWEQNSDGDIKNHRAWEVEREVDVKGIEVKQLSKEDEEKGKFGAIKGTSIVAD